MTKDEITAIVLVILGYLCLMPLFIDGYKKDREYKNKRKQ